MAREVVKKAGAAAVETTLRSVMPGLEQILSSIQADLRSLRVEMHDEIRALDAKVDNLRKEMLDRFEVTLNTINEVSHRVTRLDGKLEGYTEAMGIRLMMDEPRSTRKRRAV